MVTNGQELVYFLKNALISYVSVNNKTRGDDARLENTDLRFS